MKFVLITANDISKSTNGLSRYSFELINQFNKKKYDFKVLSPKKNGNFKNILFFSLLILPFKLFKLNADIFHSTSPDECIIPIIMRKKTIVTVHDLIYISYPRGTKFLKRAYFIFCSFFFRRAKLIITNSYFTKKEIEKRLKIPSEKIVITYFGINSKFRVIKNAKKNNSIGYLGGNIKRKNISSLIKAFNLLKKNKAFKSYKLLLAINEDIKLLHLINELELTDVVFLGKINENDIVDFYNSLSLFIYPSLYEGFGFPPLEAMACGCPVICSNRASIPEVVGDAAILVNPENIHELADSIEKLLTNEKLKNKIIQLGLKRSEKFKWQNTVNDTLIIYNNLMK
jgi:glycosyltransferase involved in cell wall biosynthesis